MQGFVPGGAARLMPLPPVTAEILQMSGFSLLAQGLSD